MISYVYLIRITELSHEVLHMLICGTVARFKLDHFLLPQFMACSSAIQPMHLV